MRPLGPLGLPSTGVVACLCLPLPHIGDVLSRQPLACLYPGTVPFPSGGWQVCFCPRAVLTKYDKLGGLKQQKCVVCSGFGGQKPEVGVSRGMPSLKAVGEPFLA